MPRVQFSNDVQYRFGDLHYAYLTVLDIGTPAVLRPVNDALVLPGGTSLPRLLSRLRHLRVLTP
jgi:hypothetical protein